jgi:hypothetical protein
VRLLAAALVLPAIVVLAIATFETGVLVRPGSNKPAQGIVWDNHTFANRAEFARWLRSHGTSYRTWARRHPSLSGVQPKRAAKQRKPAEEARQKPSVWSPELFGSVAAVLAAVGLGIVFVRRSRRPRSLRLGTRGLDLKVRRAAGAAQGAARPAVRWAGATAQRLAGLVVSAAVIAWRNLSARPNRGELAWYLATAFLAAGFAVIVTVWLNGT